MRARSWTFNGKQREWVRQWHRALQRRNPDTPPPPEPLRALGLGDRARLKRSENRDDLLAQPAVYFLVQGLLDKREAGGAPSDDEEGYGRLAIVAGVLASVKEDTGHRSNSLIGRLGDDKPHDGPRLGELRFRRIHTESRPDELLRLWRRLVAIGGSSADIAGLADDLYTWLEQLKRPPRNPSQSVRFHWAYDYYQQPRTKEAAEKTPTDSEATP